MASRRILRDTVSLFNYVGEVNGDATYQETILTVCYCPLNEGADLNMQGRKANDSARLYTFDRQTVATSVSGAKRTYLPHEQWEKEDDKSPYWTLSDEGQDYFKKQGAERQLRVVGFSHKVNGTPRMWHFEVDGR